MLLYPYSYHDQLQLHLSRYRLGMRRYLFWVVVVRKYIPNAASYLQANQQSSSPTYCKWTAGPPLSFQVPSTVGVFAVLDWAGASVSCPFWLAATASTDWLSRPDKITQVPSGNQASGLLYALLPKLAKAACAIIILAPGSSSKQFSPSTCYTGHCHGLPGTCSAVLYLYRRDKDEADQSLPSRAVFLLQPDMMLARMSINARDLRKIKVVSHVMLMLCHAMPCQLCCDTRASSISLLLYSRCAG